MTTDEFLETKKLVLKNPFEGYAIPYAYLKTLLDEYAKIKINELNKVPSVEEIDKKCFFPTDEIKNEAANVGAKWLRHRILGELDY